uniref:Uncharacterized protein n=1 Tax=Rhizophagus irregularis (strain DAOM 181602 / DAOM 197198 / MUCL 43194) TaxID=747089 RepID=U9U6E9_RHIID
MFVRFYFSFLGGSFSLQDAIFCGSSGLFGNMRFRFWQASLNTWISYFEFW